MSSKGTRARTRDEPATRGTGARHVDKEPIDWRIVGVFAVLIAVIAALFIYQEAKPFNSQDLKLHLESVDTDISEAVFLAQHRDRSTGTYFLSHLQDLSNSVGDRIDTIEQKPFDPQVREPRAKYIELGKDVSDSFHQMALLYERPEELATQVDSLNEAKRSIEQLLGSQQ